MLGAERAAAHRRARHRAPRRGGVWHGDLYLRGGGDPTFGDGTFNRVWKHGYGRHRRRSSSAQLRRRGIRRVTGQVIGDESLFDRRRGGPSTGYAADIPDFGGQLSALTFDHGSTPGRSRPARSPPGSSRGRCAERGIEVRDRAQARRDRRRPRSPAGAGQLAAAAVLLG